MAVPGVENDGRWHKSVNQSNITSIAPASLGKFNEEPCGQIDNINDNHQWQSLFLVVGEQTENSQKVTAYAVATSNKGKRKDPLCSHGTRGNYFSFLLLGVSAKRKGSLYACGRSPVKRKGSLYEHDIVCLLLLIMGMDARNVANVNWSQFLHFLSSGEMFSTSTWFTLIHVYTYTKWSVSAASNCSLTVNHWQHHCQHQRNRGCRCHLNPPFLQRLHMQTTMTTPIASPVKANVCSDYMS